jgi:hypothetical protein
MLNLKNYCTIITFILITIKVNAQDTLTSATVEQKSYQMYLDKDWSELTRFGTYAIDKGFNYYYLQLRVGIAYYEKKNYAFAEKYFLNALKFNSDDELILEYIYYCYLFNGRYQEARIWSKKFSPSLSEKIGTDMQSSVSLIMFEGGTKITSQKTYPSKDPKSKKENYFNPPIYAQVGLNHYIKNKISLFHALTYFNQQTFINKVSQVQYYLKASIPVKSSWLVSPSLHLINTNVSSEITTSITDTLWPAGVPPHSQPPPGAPPFKTTTTYTTIPNNSQSNYFIGSIAVQKTVKKFVFGIGSTILNMNNVTQYINSASLSFSPLGNSKFVLGCNGYVHTIDNYKTTCVAASPFIYIQPTKRLALKLNYFYNTKNNIVEDNGYLVNNSGDLTTSRYSILLDYTISKRVALYGLYQLENKYEAKQSFNYQYNVIVAGIKISLYKK